MMRLQSYLDPEVVPLESEECLKPLICGWNSKLSSTYISPETLGKHLPGIFAGEEMTCCCGPVESQKQELTKQTYYFLMFPSGYALF